MRTNLVWRGISQLSASAVFRQASTAALLITGSTPGMPVQISQTLEFGGSPNCPTAHPQNIFVRVRGWTCTSMPMTTSHSVNWSHLGLDPAPPLSRARDSQCYIPPPLRGQDLQAHR